MRDFSYQLYSSRNFGPMPETLSMLVEAGYRQVEGFGALYDEPGNAETLRAALDAAGLSMPTGHFGFDAVVKNPSQVIETARSLGMSGVIVPYLAPADRPTDANGWDAFAKALAEAGKPIVDAGFAYGWHNHDFEFDTLENGDRLLDLLLSQGDHVQLELDLGWAYRAGENPADWANKYADRIMSVHVKDVATDGECADEDGWADVGHGTIDWRDVMAAVDASSARHFVMEHDNPSDDARFARRSIEAANAF